MLIAGKNYNRCTKKMPCPVCERTDWCLVSDDGNQAICQRTQQGSVKSIGNAGHLFELNGQTFNPVKKVSKTKEYPPDPAYIREVYLNLDFNRKALEPLAEKLGVSIDSLQALGCGKSVGSWDFPMYDEKRKLIGIKRRCLNGTKFCVRHSQLGIIIPKRFNYKKRAIVLEGESDTAAMYDLGYNVIGRPNTTAGMYMLACLLRNQESVILSDNEGKKIHPITGAVSYPGPQSAYTLDSMLLGKSCVVVCPVKDARLWVQTGGFSKKWLEQLIRMPYKTFDNWLESKKG